MRDDLIKIISGQKKLTHVVITTFNIDFLFIESVLLRELRKCGHPTLTIFADADEVASSFTAQGAWVSRVGRRYRVVPVSMEPGFRFHPKAVLLSGTDGAELLIGSGNLTFGGMRQNDELWVRYSTVADGKGPLAAFRAFTNQCLERTVRPDPARIEIREAFDPTSRSWGAELTEASGLLSRAGRGDSLLNQITSEVADLGVRRILIGSPYFDERGDALVAIADQWPGALVEVFVQEMQSQLCQAAWNRVREPKRLISVSTSRDQRAATFIHAKFYAFVGDSEAVIFAGSANCSRAALTIPGWSGNAELLAIMRMPTADVEVSVLSGLKVHELLPTLVDVPPEPVVTDAVPTVRILAATHQGGELVVDYSAPAATQAIELIVDGNIVSAEGIQFGNGELQVKWRGTIGRIQISAIVHHTRITSSPHWVDHEFILGATSFQRQIAQAVGANVCPSAWNFQGWIEVMGLLGDHLRHATSEVALLPKKSTDKKQDPQAIEATEFFTADYRLPSSRFDHSHFDDASRLDGLRATLLQYFGVDIEGDETSESVDEDIENDEVVDRLENEKRKSKDNASKPKKRNLTEAERRRGQRIVRLVIETCASSQFIETRPGSMLASDLAIAAVLLISGYAEEWLSHQEFLDLTYRLWIFLFFDDGRDELARSPNIGALSRRHNELLDKHEFERAVGTPRLAAALATWSFCCPKNVPHTETARFQVATRLAIARLPWLWCLNDSESVAKELSQITQRTGWLGSDVESRWEEVCADWNRLITEGIGLALLEHYLNSQDLSDLRSAILDDVVPVGTLLWQGAALGFCVLTQSARRKAQASATVSVLTLRATKRETKLAPPYLLPFRSLLRVVMERSPNRLSQNQLQSLNDFAERLETMMASGL